MATILTTLLVAKSTMETHSKAAVASFSSSTKADSQVVNSRSASRLPFYEIMYIPSP